MTDTFSEYQKMPGMNASVIKAGLVSMRHMRYAALYPPSEPTPAMRWGKIVHSAVLEPDKFKIRYAVWSGASRRGKDYDNFCCDADDDGREVITVAESNDALYMAKAVRENARAAELLACLTRVESSIAFDLDGQPCKARPDGVGSGYFIDLKTSGDISPRAFERTAYNLGYHVQMGFYAFGLDKLSKATAAIHHSAYIIALESDAPYDCIVYECGRSFLERGMLEADRIMREYAACCKRGVWPGQSAQTLPLEVPTWAMPDVELK